jgi:hypothetical protein
MDSIVKYYQICTQENPRMHILQNANDSIKKTLFSLSFMTDFFLSEDRIMVNETIIGGDEDEGSGLTNNDSNRTSNNNTKPITIIY